MMAAALSGQACGGGDSGGGGDKAACQALADPGRDAASYPRLLKMGLSSEMRKALVELRDSTGGDTFDKEGKVAALCAAGRDSHPPLVPSSLVGKRTSRRKTPPR